MVYIARKQPMAHELWTLAGSTAV